MSPIKIKFLDRSNFHEPKQSDRAIVLSYLKSSMLDGYKMKETKNDIIVTGMPRGGTTLLGSLISSLDNVFCISEPFEIEKLLHDSHDRNDFVNKIANYYSLQRQIAIKNKKLINRVSVDGSLVTNYFVRNGDKILLNYNEREVDIETKDPNFKLAVKHNAHFMSVLPEIIKLEKFTIAAVVRHPVPTIMSWRSLNLPISRGRLPSGEKYWNELADIANSKADTLTKQVLIYELILKRLIEFKGYILLLSYEQIVNDVEVISKLFGLRFKRKIKVSSQNKSSEYNWNEIDSIKSAIKENCPTTSSVYEIEDIEKEPSFEY